jgi:hypothetical protein
VLATWVMRSTMRACRRNDVSHRSNCSVIGDAGSLSPQWAELHLALDGTTSWRNPERVRQTRWASRRVSWLEEEWGTLTFEAALPSTGQDDFLARLHVQAESLGTLHDRSGFPPGSRAVPDLLPSPDQGLPCSLRLHLPGSFCAACMCRDTMDSLRSVPAYAGGAKARGKESRQDSLPPPALRRTYCKRRPSER